MDIQIITLNPDQWEDYKKIRIAALEESPEAFGQSLENVLSYTEEKWRERLIKSQNEENFWLFFARVSGDIVGLIGARLEEGEKFKHIAIIFSVFVKTEYRDQGVAAKLMQLTIEKLKQKPFIKKTRLHVVTSQIPAINLYKKFGFEIVGTLKEELHSSDGYLDEYLMEKFF